MTSLPDPSNDYAAPLVLKVTRLVWDTVFSSIGSRLRALEATEADYDNAIGQLQTLALAVITQTITEEVDSRRAELEALTGDAAELADEVAFIRSGGVDAGSVTLAEVAGIASANAQDAIAELLGKIEAETSARTDAFAAIKPVKFITITESAALISGGAYRITAATAVTVTLPATPASGDTIRIIDITGADHVLARNAQTIMEAAEDVTLDAVGLDFQVWFDGTTWRFF